MSELNEKQARFADEYLVDLNATQAAIRAGYSAKTAYSQGVRLLKHVEVARLIAEGQAKRAERVEISKTAVLQRWWEIATADPNDLIEYRRTCCRYCHGKNHRYQETHGERERRLSAFEVGKRRTAGTPEADDYEHFDELGGTGFDIRKDPAPECPECFGEGQERAFPKDTRTLPPGARALYAGVKVTQQGLEIKMHSQDGALANVAKHLGMFVEKHEHSGPGGAPIKTADATVEALAKLSPKDRALLREMAKKLEGSGE